MLRVAVALCLVSLAFATPSIVRSREEIEEFRHFLESTKTDDGELFITRTTLNPNANAEENSGKFQGDIVLDEFIIDGMLKDFAEGRNAYTWPNTKWPEDTVVWEYAEDTFEPFHKEAIEAAIKDIEEASCLKFRKRTPTDTAYVRVTGFSDGCYAHVGYWQSRGVHTFNLALNTPGVGCFRYGTIVHEWLHILGFFHMQSTHDRDNYVNIVTENIIPASAHNFNIYTPDLVSNLDVEYDYISCLHYSQFAFTVNGLPTIVALREHEGEMGQRVIITDKDWLRLNRHYECPGAWSK